MSHEQIVDWCEKNLFGERDVEGHRIPLSGTQQSILMIAVEIIEKWESRNHEAN